MSDVVRPGGQLPGGKLVTRDRKRLNKEAPHPTILEFESPTRALISLPVPKSARIVAPLMAMLVLTTVGATAIVPVDVVVTAQGKLNAIGGTFVVQPLDAGIVRSIEVHEGEAVKAGQVLAKLDPTLAAADVTALRNSVKSLDAEIIRLEAEATEKPYVASADDAAQQFQAAFYAQRRAQLTAQRNSYREKIGSLETQVSANLAMAAFYKQRLTVAQNVEDMRQQLEHLQVGSKLNTMAAADNRLEMQRNMVSSQAAAATGKVNLQEMVAERDQAEQQWFAQISQDITDQSRKLSDAREQLKKALLHDKLVELRAPEDAIVQSVARVSIGSIMQSGDQFFTLVPSDSQLNAQVYVQGSDAGWPHVGDSATIKLDTFSFTTYGMLIGTVRVISPDSFTTQDASPSVGNAGTPNTRAQAGSAQPVSYRTTIAIDRNELHNTPPDFHLRPGMPVTVDIKVAKRTMLTYMLGRILPVFSEGMREP